MKVFDKCNNEPEAAINLLKDYLIEVDLSKESSVT